MDRGIKWNYTRVHLTWNFALCVILLFFSAAKCRKCALDWWLLHRGNCPNAIGCGDLHTWLRSSPKTCCYYWVAQGKVVSPTLSPENKAWSSWAIWVPGDCISSNEFPFISQTFCFCLSQHNIAWWHHKDNCFPQKYLLTLAVSIHILKFLISCELVQSVVYFKSVCVFSSQARNLVSWMNPFSPIASCLFWNLPFSFSSPVHIENTWVNRDCLHLHSTALRSSLQVLCWMNPMYRFGWDPPLAIQVSRARTVVRWTIPSSYIVLQVE